MYTYLMGGYKENGAIPFPVVSGEGMRGNGHKLKYRIVNFNTRKSFFTVRLVEYWQRLSGGVLESPSVLVSAGIELIFFLVAGTVLCFGFSVRITLITG